MEIQSFEFRVANIARSGEIEGLGAAFGNVDSYGTMIVPGAFKQTLLQHAQNKTRPAMLLHHKLDRPIGTWHELRETSEGLEVSGKISTDTRDGQEAYALARDGALTGLSIGFRIKEKQQLKTATEILALDLFEISMVSIPANDKARLRRVNSFGTVRDIEEILREGGMSRRVAKRAAFAAWNVSQGDGDEGEAEEILRHSIAEMQYIRKV